MLVWLVFFQQITASHDTHLSDSWHVVVSVNPGVTHRIHIKPGQQNSLWSLQLTAYHPVLHCKSRNLPSLCLSFHNCSFYWDDNIVHFCCAQLDGLYANRCRTEMSESRSKACWLNTQVIYLVCCRGKIYWLWRQQLSGTNQCREGDMGPFPPVMDMHNCVFGAGKFVIENPTLPQILQDQIEASHKNHTHTHSCRLKVYIPPVLLLYYIMSELNNRFCKEMIQLWPLISIWSYCKWPHNLDRIQRVEFYSHYLQIPITNLGMKWKTNLSIAWISYIRERKVLNTIHHLSQTEFHA